MENNAPELSKFCPVKDRKHLNLLLSTLDVVSNYFPSKSYSYITIQYAMKKIVREDIYGLCNS